MNRDDAWPPFFQFETVDEKTTIIRRPVRARRGAPAVNYPPSERMDNGKVPACQATAETIKVSHVAHEGICLTGPKVTDGLCLTAAAAAPLGHFPVGRCCRAPNTLWPKRGPRPQDSGLRDCDSQGPRPQGLCSIGAVVAPEDRLYSAGAASSQGVCSIGEVVACQRLCSARALCSIGAEQLLDRSSDRAPTIPLGGSPLLGRSSGRAPRSPCSGADFQRTHFSSCGA
jgi:hypothetical protein